jgi:hypothetical protein
MTSFYVELFVAACGFCPCWLAFFFLFFVEEFLFDAIGLLLWLCILVVACWVLNSLFVDFSWKTDLYFILEDGQMILLIC